MASLGYHYRFGLHSGIPKCCVTFWVLWYHQLPKWLTVWLTHRLERRYPFYIPARFQYVRCPLCIIRSRWLGTQHICDPEMCPPRSWFMTKR